MAVSPLPPELQELIERVATYPRGLGFLRQADPECVAVLLGVHPFAVARAREYLETADGRARLVGELRRARLRLRRQPPTTPEREQIPPDPVSPGNAEELIEAARQHSLGLPFLLEAPFETVAVIFGVHPDLVLRARSLLSREPEGTGAGAEDNGKQAPGR